MYKKGMPAPHKSIGPIPSPVMGADSQIPALRNMSGATNIHALPIGGGSTNTSHIPMMAGPTNTSHLPSFKKGGATTTSKLPPKSGTGITTGRIDIRKMPNTKVTTKPKF